MGCYDVCIYLKSANDVEMLGITKELVGSYLYKKFRNSQKEVKRVMLTKDVFFLMELLSGDDRNFKISFFFLERFKIFRLKYREGKIKLMCFVPTIIFDAYQEFFDSKNIQYTWKDIL